MYSAGTSKFSGRLGTTHGFGAVDWKFGKIVDIAVGSAFALVVTSDGWWPERVSKWEVGVGVVRTWYLGAWDCHRECSVQGMACWTTVPRVFRCTHHTTPHNTTPCPRTGKVYSFGDASR